MLSQAGYQNMEHLFSGHISTTAMRIKIGREFRNENSGKDVGGRIR